MDGARRRLLRVVWGLVGLAVAGGALVCAGGLSLGAWAVGNGPQHSVDRILGDDCTWAVLMAPDGDGGVQDAAVALTTSATTPGARPPGLLQRTLVRGIVGLLMPTRLASCSGKDAWAFAYNPWAGGRSMGWVLRRATAPAAEVHGARFIRVEKGVWLGMVDGTLVGASDVAHARQTIAALVGGDASRAHGRLGAARGDADVVVEGLLPMPPVRTRYVIDLLANNEATVQVLPLEAVDSLATVCDAFASLVELPGSDCIPHPDGEPPFVELRIRRVSMLLGVP